MPRCFRRRSPSMGSVRDEPIDHINQKYCETSMVSKAEDLETARQLLSSLLFTKDASGRSYLHTNFHLSWAKALLDRAKNLDEDSEQYVGFRMTSINGRYRNGGTQNKESVPFSHHTRNNNTGTANVNSTLVQRRFLLQCDKESGYTPFHVAIMERNLAAILLFLRHATRDDKSTERLTQRPMTLLHAAEANHGHNHTNSNKSSRRNNSLLLAIANATDHEGMTPLRLLGRLQQPELSRCRNYLRSFRPSVDRNAIMKLCTRRRQPNFDNSNIGNDSENENIDYLSENADLLHIHKAGSEYPKNSYHTKNESYACEVVTFGRPHHCALGVVQGGSSPSSAFVSSTNKDSINQTYSHSSAFCPQRVQEFAQNIVGRQGSAISVAAATHHSLVVTKKGHLYAFGLEKGGRLGLGDDQPQQCPLPKRVLGPLQRRHVVSVAAAENHSLCVTSQGDIYSWGSNRFGQLGDGSPITPCGSRSIPRRVENLKQHPCVAVAAGEKHSVALSWKGEVYVWGDNMSGQLGVPRRTGIQKVQRVEALWGTSTSQSNNNSSPKITIAIAAAAQSTLVLTTGSPSSRLSNVNAIYEWGHGNHVPIRVHFESYNNAASNKNDNIHRSSPFSSSFSRTPNPAAIACARFHNAVITSDGMVYTWGLHAESLGRSTSNSYQKQQQHQRRNSSPQLVSGLLPKKGGGFAVAIDASESHTAVVCDNGSLFTWGTTDGNNVLGHEGVRWQPNPKRVPGVHRAVDVAVAKEHTILLIGASLPSIPNNNMVLRLEVLAARKVAEYVDLFNAIPILMMAERIQSLLLIQYCTDFVRRNLDGVLNVGKKSVMNQYLNEMLAETTYIAGKSYRDDHHHPLIFDVLAAGNVGRPTFDCNRFSDFEEWIQGCKELAQSKVVRRLLEVAAVREYEEDSTRLNVKARRSSSCQKEYYAFKQSTYSTLESSLIPDAKEGNLDSCIKRTASMNLSTIELANENAAWLSKEIRGVRKKLKQISNLVYAETQEVVLSSEQKAKVARRSTLEIELSIYESAVEEVRKQMKEFDTEIQPNQKLLSSPEVDACQEDNKAQKQMIGTQENESLVGNAEKLEDPSGSIPVRKDDKPFFCDICGVKCSDKSNFILHQNGRKHRNRLAQLAEEEKEKTAASIRQQQQMELMKSASIFTPPSENILKNVWGTASSQPDYKLPPPPHPVLAQVAPMAPKRSLIYARSAPPKMKPTTPYSKLKTVAKEIGRAKKNQSHASVGADLPSSLNHFSLATSDFTAILREQESGKKRLNGGTKQSSKPFVWDPSPSSTHCIPQSAYSAHDPSSTPNKVLNIDERSSCISLADFLTPRQKKPVSSSDTTPWMKGLTNKPKISPVLNSKSIAQIQAEEESLKSKQDKSYGKGGGSWYIERRERADSVLEIQKVAKEDLRQRLLVDEQLKIEAQIREENERRQKLEKSRKDRGGPKRRRKKKTPNSNMSNFCLNDVKTEAKASDAAKSNCSHGKNKPSNKFSNKVTNG